jgi:hypothetical protein
MGLFKRDRDESGSKGGGLLGRAVILEVKPHRTTVQVMNGLTERTCEFRVEVSLDNQPRYEASCKQRVPEVYIPQLQSPNATVAVRVDANNLAKISLAFDEEPPTVTIAREAGEQSAADILASGTPAEAVIVANEPIGMRTPEGVEVQAFKLTVIPGSGDPYQVEVGNATPPTALPFLFPGSRVPVKLGHQPNDVVIDWQAAQARAS